MAISRAPYILVIHLKRFAYANMNAKLTKAVRFTMELNLPCTDQNLIDKIDGKVRNDNGSSNNSMSMMKYQLYAVIVHCGSSTHSGHYYAYVKVRSSTLLCYTMLSMLYIYYTMLSILYTYYRLCYLYYTNTIACYVGIQWYLVRDE